MRKRRIVHEASLVKFPFFCNKLSSEPFPSAASIKKLGSYSGICWYGPFPIAPLIQLGGSTCWPQASRARRQPRSLGRFLVATPLKRLSHCLRRLW
jgi:hypothetical protein